MRLSRLTYLILLCSGPKVTSLKKHKNKIVVIGNDPNGAMYGLFDVIETLRYSGSLKKVNDKLINPALNDRFIKFNLPWMSYRKGEALQVHMETCRDTVFWESFLDMMALNRFNRLSLWNLHPFSYMVRPENFPKASPFTDEELADWKKFWKTLFSMAKQRGIETYIVNWNIFVSPEFTEHYGGA
ncbi:MAG: hypothetical protein HC906_00785 [Bacteroidales bacterium]|nr:hypothetical protein [Bacteroidales bacterium]